MLGCRDERHPEGFWDVSHPFYAILFDMQRFISHNLEETAQIARNWLLGIGDVFFDYAQNKPHPEHPEKALVVGLSGHLGAGKTAFVKAVARALGIEESVTSPTFVIMKVYDVGANSRHGGQGGVENKDKSAGGSIQWKRLVHIDLYRLEKKEEMVALKLEEIIADKNNLIMIEWPENVGIKVDKQIDFRALEEAGVYEVQPQY